MNESRTREAGWSEFLARQKGKPKTGSEEAAASTEENRSLSKDKLLYQSGRKESVSGEVELGERFQPIKPSKRRIIRRNGQRTTEQPASQTDSRSTKRAGRQASDLSTNRPSLRYSEEESQTDLRLWVGAIFRPSARASLMKISTLSVGRRPMEEFGTILECSVESHSEEAIGSVLVNFPDLAFLRWLIPPAN